MDLNFTSSTCFPVEPDLTYPGEGMDTGILIGIVMSLCNLVLHRCVLILSHKGAFLPVSLPVPRHRGGTVATGQCRYLCLFPISLHCFGCFRSGLDPVACLQAC